jgi:hypothetical protein
MNRPSPGRRLIAGILLVAVVGTAGVARLRYTQRRVHGSSPAVAVQGFVTALAEHRFDAAMIYLSDRLRTQIIPLTLQVRTTNLERRTGRISAVQGRTAWQADTRAYAIAAATTELAGPLELGFGLLRDNGGWRIDELYDLYR